MELISDALFSFQRRGSTDGNARGCHLEESVSQTGFIMWNAAIPWYPIYLAIEILFVFLNPDKPPRSLWCGIWVTVVVLLGAALVASAALSVAVSRIFRAFDTTDCFRCGSPKAQRLSIQKQQQLRVFVFFAFLTLAMFGVVGYVIILALNFTHKKTVAFTTVGISIACLGLIVSSMTVPRF